MQTSKRRLIALILSLVALVLALIVIGRLNDEITQAVDYLRTANYAWLVLLVPTVIAQYYCAGRIWYPYLGERYGVSALELARIQYELNFLSMVVPAGEVSAFVYVTERLKLFGVPAGTAGTMFVYRYVVSIGTNIAGMILAVGILFCCGMLSNVSVLPLLVIGLMIVAILVMTVVGLAAITGKLRFRNARLSGFFREMNETLTVVVSDRKALISSLVWGSLYTLFEDLPFLVVAAAFGVPQIFLQSIVAGVAGNFAGAIVPTPGGIGGFDAAMIWLMGGIGVEVSLAAIIVIVERVLILVGTTITGYPLFQQAMVDKIGRGHN